MWRYLLFLMAALRVAVPLLIFKNPVVVTLFYTPVLDGWDGYVAFKAKLNRRKYNAYDKVLDYWWYIFILVYMRTTPLFGVFLILFLFRTIGQWVSIITGNEKVLFVFPGVIETYFIIYLISLVFPETAFLFQGSLQIIPLGIAAIAALVREYIIHIKKISLSKRFLGIGPEWIF